MLYLNLKFLGIFLPALLFGELFVVEINSTKEILACKVCDENRCERILDCIFPIDKEKYLLILPYKRASIFLENKRYRNFKIKNLSHIKDKGQPLFIQKFNLNKYDYFLGKDEKGNWKVFNISEKEEAKKNLFIEENNFEKINGDHKKRAIYFWDTIEILKSKKKWENISNKLMKAYFNKIYIQIPYKINEDKNWSKRKNSFFNFIKCLLKNNMKLGFLDGYKGFALEPFHNKVLVQIEELKYFWEKNFSNFPFPPIHLDIEPYLLKFYNNLNYKEIYGEYISLLKKIKENFPEVELNLDIPFWLDNLDEEILKEIIKYSDGITIMAYRSKVYGSNGIIDITEKEVALAKKENKKVYIAIETMELLPEKIYGIFDAKNEKFPLYLHKTMKENLFLISDIPSEYGIKVIEEIPPDFISLYKYN